MMTKPNSSVQITSLVICLIWLLCSLLDSHAFKPRADDKDDNVPRKSDKSSFRHQAATSRQQQQQQQDPTEQAPRREDKHQFRIGLIVPRTAFLSQYKTYTQRIKDTFSQMLQLSRHQQVKSKQQQQPHSSGFGSSFPTSALFASSQTQSTLGSAAVTSSQQNFQQDNKLPASSCLSNSRALLASQHHYHHKLMPWPNLTFNQYFDIKVVDQVNLSARSSAHDIIDLMCHHLIEQNLSVIIYLENNQDQTVSSSLDSAPSSSVATHQQSSSYNNNNQQQLKLQHLRQPSLQSGQKSRSEQPAAASPSIDAAASLRVGPSAEVQQASSQAHFIMHLAHSAGIPMIAWSVTATLAQRPKKQRTLHLAPTVAHEAEAMLAILERYSWHSFSVVSTTLAGHDDFILALRQFMATVNSGPKQQQQQQNLSSSTLKSLRRAAFATQDDSLLPGDGQRQQEQISTQPPRTFKLLDVITIKKRSLGHIEQELRHLTASESRVILLYATKGEAIDILKVASRLRLTKRSYAWIVAQSVIGSNENERAPAEFHPGLLGIYFRSNHERLLDELSRAITIIAHGLERLVRDRNITAHLASGHRPIEVGDDPKRAPANGSDDGTNYEHQRQQQQPRAGNHHKLLASHSKCYGPIEELSERRADLLYEYFRKSSPFNVFDADGSLKDVELSVVNLDNERQWRRIGCFSDAKLTIDDITWPEQSERPPSGTMEKFHLRAVFLEEPSFVNLAEPDAETGECKTNRAVKCRYKVLNLAKNVSSPPQQQQQPPPPNATTVLANENFAHQLNRTTDDHDGGSGAYEYKCCSGFCIDLMEKFAADLKFDYDLYRVPDGFWGIFENNTWNGLIGEIVKGQADVIVSSIKINSDRQKAVDFTVPFLDTGISIIVSKQTGVIAKLAFLEPFDTLAWVMFICVGIPLAATSIFLFEWLSPGGFYAQSRSARSAAINRRPVGPTGEPPPLSSTQERAAPIGAPLTTREAHKFSFCRTLWLVVTILFGSAAHIDSPKGYTARFMSNVWATFAVVFLAVYTANLAAFMITREEYLELSGIEDSRLAYPYHRHPALKFGTITGGNTHAVLGANKPNLYNYMKRFNRPSVEDGVDAVKMGALDAFVYDALVLDYMASQDPECRLVNVGAWYSMTGYALAFPRNSRYYQKFDMKMLEYRKNGELDRLRRFWLQGQCKPGQSRHSISKPLDLSQFMSAFLLLGAGILCAVLVLVLEHLYVIFLRDRLMRSRNRKRIMDFLYPFSLSLTDTLRLPADDNDDDHGAAEHEPANTAPKLDQQQPQARDCHKLDDISSSRSSECNNELVQAHRAPPRVHINHSPAVLEHNPAAPAQLVSGNSKDSSCALVPDYHHHQLQQQQQQHHESYESNNQTYTTTDTTSSALASSEMGLAQSRRVFHHEDELRLLTVLLAPGQCGSDKPVCISAAKQERIRLLLQQLRLFILEGDEAGIDARNSTLQQRQLLLQVNPIPPPDQAGASAVRIKHYRSTASNSLHDLVALGGGKQSSSVHDYNPAELRSAAAAAQVCRVNQATQVGKQTNKAKRRRNLSTSLASGLESKLSSDSKRKLETTAWTITTTKANANDSHHFQDQEGRRFATDRYDNKETLL